MPNILARKTPAFPEGFSGLTGIFTKVLPVPAVILFFVILMQGYEAVRVFAGASATVTDITSDIMPQWNTYRAAVLGVYGVIFLFLILGAFLEYVQTAKFRKNVYGQIFVVNVLGFLVAFFSISFSLFILEAIRPYFMPIF